MASTAREIVTGGAQCVQEDETVLDAAKRMQQLDVGALPICGSDDRLKGMITDRDILQGPRPGQGPRVDHGRGVGAGQAGHYRRGRRYRRAGPHDGPARGETPPGDRRAHPGGLGQRGRPGRARHPGAGREGRAGCLRRLTARLVRSSGSVRFTERAEPVCPSGWDTPARARVPRQAGQIGQYQWSSLGCDERSDRPFRSPLRLLGGVLVHADPCIGHLMGRSGSGQPVGSASVRAPGC